MNDENDDDNAEFRDQRAAWEVYCSRVVHLLDATTRTGASGTVSRSGRKCSCRGNIISGLPIEARGTQWDLCAACVVSHKLVAWRPGQAPGSLDRRLADLYPDVGPAALDLVRSMARPGIVAPEPVQAAEKPKQRTTAQRTLDDKIATLEIGLTQARTAEDKAGLKRLLDAARRARLSAMSAEARP